MLFGLAGHHGKEHIFRALMEGIALEQRLSFEGMETGLERPIDVLLVTGGGSRSALWRQILADATRKPVVACRELETTALGAGIHAAVAAGWYGSLPEAAAAMTGEGARHDPDERTAVVYDRLFEVYRELYPRTAAGTGSASTSGRMRRCRRRRPRRPWRSRLPAGPAAGAGRAAPRPSARRAS
jgi:xylulokinase